MEEKEIDLRKEKGWRKKEKGEDVDIEEIGKERNEG